MKLFRYVFVSIAALAIVTYQSNNTSCPEKSAFCSFSTAGLKNTQSRTFGTLRRIFLPFGPITLFINGFFLIQRDGVVSYRQEMLPRK